MDRSITVFEVEGEVLNISPFIMIYEIGGTMMSEITTLQHADSLLLASITDEEKIVSKALAAAINSANNCGQTSVVFSTRLSESQIKELESKSYRVTISGVSNPQYIISWKTTPESEEK